jgi:hypothetical protein
VSKAPQSVTSVLRGLKSRAPSVDIYLAEMTKLADLDQQSDAFEKVDRLFALRERIANLRQRIQELEGHK